MYQFIMYTVHLSLVPMVIKKWVARLVARLATVASQTTIKSTKNGRSSGKTTLSNYNHPLKIE